MSASDVVKKDKLPRTIDGMIRWKRDADAYNAKIDESKKSRVRNTIHSFSKELGKKLYTGRLDKTFSGFCFENKDREFEAGKRYKAKYVNGKKFEYDFKKNEWRQV